MRLEKPAAKSRHTFGSDREPARLGALYAADHVEMILETQGSQIDYGGARGSNTGDEFHELWAVRQTLGLLDMSSGLTAITVEGVSCIDGSGSSWDGVDCTLLFGGEDLKGAGPD